MGKKFTYTGLVPFPKVGGGTEMLPNKIWEDDLVLVECWPGNGGADFMFKSLISDGRFRFSLNGFRAVYPNMVNGRIKGSFVFAKRGNSYLIYQVANADLSDNWKTLTDQEFANAKVKQEESD